MPGQIGMQGLDLADGMADAPGDGGAGPFAHASQLPVSAAQPQRFGEHFDQLVEFLPRALGAAGIVHVFRFRNFLLQIADAKFQGLPRLVVEDELAAIGFLLAPREIETVNFLSRAPDEALNVAQSFYVG